MILKKELIYLALSVSLIIFSSCEKNDDIATECIKGKGALITSKLLTANFTGVDLAIPANISIRQGVTKVIEVKGHANMIDLLSTKVSNGIWKIEFKNDICTEDLKLSFVITLPTIDKIILSNSGNIVVENFSNQKSLNIDVSGSGNLTLNKFEGISKFDVSLNGSGNISTNSDISTLKVLNLTNTASGNYSGFSISANDCTVSSSGSGNCELTSKNMLNVTITKSGDVSYKGNPKITKSITSTGKLIDAN